MFSFFCFPSFILFLFCCVYVNIRKSKKKNTCVDFVASKIEEKKIIKENIEKHARTYSHDCWNISVIF